MTEDFQNSIVTLSVIGTLIFYKVYIKIVVHLDINFSKKCFFVLKFSSIYANADDFAPEGSKRLKKE